MDLDTRISIDFNTAIPLDYDISLLKIIFFPTLKFELY